MVGEKLARIEGYLARRGIELRVERRSPADPAAIAEAEHALGHPIPADLKEIYLRFGDGFEVSWEEVRAPKDFDFGRFALPDLGSFLRATGEFRAETRRMDDDPLNYFDRPEEARVILKEMLRWGVLWDAGGDGDLVCIDLETGAVLYHEREWLFYDTYANGFLIAPGVNELIEGWGGVCFLNFPGAPGDCPDRGAPTVPDYGSQRFRIAE